MSPSDNSNTHSSISTVCWFYWVLTLKSSLPLPLVIFDYVLEILFETICTTMTANTKTYFRTTLRISSLREDCVFPLWAQRSLSSQDYLKTNWRIEIPGRSIPRWRRCMRKSGKPWSSQLLLMVTSVTLDLLPEVFSPSTLFLPRLHSMPFSNLKLSYVFPSLLFATL